MRIASTLIAALALTSGGLVVTQAAATAASDGSTKLSVSYSKLMKYETFEARGQVKGASGPRTVKLQYESGSSWKTYATDSTSSTGRFIFYVTGTTKTRTYRYYAPKSGSKKAVKGDPRTVKVVGQHASVHVYPADVCVGSSASIRLDATFSPARRGRDVYLTSIPGSYLGDTDRAGRLITGDIGVDTSSLGRKSVKVIADSFHASGEKTVRAYYNVITCDAM